MYKPLKHRENLREPGSRMEYIATSYKIEKQKATEIVRHYFSIFLGVTMKYMFFFDNELIWGVPKMGVSQIIPR